MDNPIVINQSELSDAEILQLHEMGFEEIEQGTQEWHQERLGLATASRMYDIVDWTTRGEPKPKAAWFKYMNELVAERLSGDYKRFSNKYTEWGKNNEENAALEYERITGNPVKTLGFIKLPDMDAGASLDREVGTDGLVEIKCPNTDTMVDYVLNGVPPMYYAQMQFQMYVAHKKWGDFVVFDPALENIYVQHVERNDDYINNTILPRLTSFLRQVDEREQRMRDLGYGK